MPVVLDHMTVPVRDAEAAVDFYGKIFAGRRGAARGRIIGFWLSPILELQFRQVDAVDSSHYAFRVEPDEFESTLDRMRAAGILFGGNRDGTDGAVLIGEGLRRSIFFSDPNGHALELMTG